MKLHFLQHVPFEGPGSIGPWAGRHGFSITSTGFFAGDPLPAMGAFDWLVILGGPMNVHEDLKHPWLRDEKTFIEKAMESGKTVIGVCLGAQLIADAMGACVHRNTHSEIGWFPIHKAKGAGRSALSSFLPDSPDAIDAFHWHGDTFDLPSGTVQLARSEACENQVFAFDNRVVGLQFHLETTRQSAERLIEQCREEMDGGPFIQTPEQILSGNAPFQKINNAMDALLDTLFNI